MSVLIFLFIVLLLLGFAGTSAILSLVGKGIRGILSLFGLTQNERTIERERPSWKEDVERTPDDEENKLEIRTEDGLRRIKKMKDSAETIDFEVVEEVKEEK